MGTVTIYYIEYSERLIIEIVRLPMERCAGRPGTVMSNLQPAFSFKKPIGRNSRQQH